MMIKLNCHGLRSELSFFTGVVTLRSSMTSVCTNERCTASRFPCLRSPTRHASWWTRTPSWWRLSHLSKHLRRAPARATTPSSTPQAPLERDCKSWVPADQPRPTPHLCLSPAFQKKEKLFTDSAHPYFLIGSRVEKWTMHQDTPQVTEDARTEGGVV